MQTCQIPPIGFGVFELGDETYRAVRHALNVGYRHIDTAAFYGNEAEVGRAIRDSGVPREQIFLATKLWPTDYADVRGGCEQSLRRLGLAYVDAYLLHWPGTDTKLRLNAWEAVLRLKDAGLVCYPAVSNFLKVHLSELMEKIGVAPAYDQLELHPWYRQREAVDYGHAHGVQQVAWAPLYRGRVLSDPVITELAHKYGRTNAQVVLHWDIQRAHNPIPKSATPARIEENFDVFDFELTVEDAARIDALEDGDHMSFDPMTFNGIIPE
jgi:diketogulonate reductase-like aldo/keto reductase